MGGETVIFFFIGLLTPGASMWPSGYKKDIIVGVKVYQGAVPGVRYCCFHHLEPPNGHCCN